jgi:uncharacterized membrane protein
MRKPNESLWHWMLGRLRTYFLAGLFVVVPLAVATLVLVWVFNSIDNILQPILTDMLGRHIVGLGLAVTVALVFIAGIIASNFVGRKILHYTDALLKRVPIFRQLYTGAKQVMESISGAGLNKAAFRKVVFVEFPLAGMKTIAFVTNEQTDPEGNKLYSIYIPTSPTPTSGYYMIATADKINPSDISVDEAMKMIISAGIIGPKVVDIDKISTEMVQNGPK